RVGRATGAAGRDGRGTRALSRAAAGRGGAAECDSRNDARVRRAARAARRRIGALTRRQRSQQPFGSLSVSCEPCTFVLVKRRTPQVASPACEPCGVAASV